MIRVWEKEMMERFPFMACGAEMPYSRFGCECGAGWAALISEMCGNINACFAEHGLAPELVPVQLKQKFGRLVFYYRLQNSPPELRREISAIVDAASEKSRTVCEVCGASGARLRDDRPTVSYIQTLCDHCHELRFCRVQERRRRRQI